MRISPLCLSPLAALALISCNSQEEELRVERSWVNLAAVPGNPAAAYFTIRGGPAADALISASTDMAIRTEIHESMKQGGMMTMTPLDRVEVPAKGTVVFAPGGKHLMIFELRSTVKPGGTLRMELSFGNGERLLLDAPVLPAGQKPEGVD